MIATVVNSPSTSVATGSIANTGVPLPTVSAGVQLEYSWFHAISVCSTQQCKKKQESDNKTTSSFYNLLSITD